MSLEIKIGADIGDVDKALNKVGASLNGLKKPALNAQYTLSTLSGVARDLPFGFIAIQNNLPLVIDSFAQLSKQAGGTVPALKSIGAALTGPAGIAFAFGAAVSGVTALVQKYGSLSAALTDIFGLIQNNTQLQNAYNQSIVETTSKSEAEGLVLKNLTSILTDSTKSVNQRTGAYQAINKEYPGLLDNISKESALTSAGNKLIQDRTNLYLRQIILQGQQESLVKLISKAYESQNQALADVSSGDYFTILGLQLKGLIQGDINPATQALSALNNTFKNGGKQIDFYSNILKGVQNELTGVDAQVNKLANGEKERQKALKSAEDAEKKSAKLKKEHADALEKYNKAVEKNRQLGVQFNLKAEDLAIKKAQEREKAESDLFDQLVETSMANERYGNITDKIAKTALSNVTSAIQSNIKNLENAQVALNEVFFNPLTEAFSNFFETGKFAFKDFAKSVLSAISQIVSKIIATGIIKLLANLLFPGAGGQMLGAFGGQSAGGFFKGIIGDVLGFKQVAAPSFAGVGGGSMGMSGSVNLTLRGTDLVGAINRTNTNISRVG